MRIPDSLKVGGHDYEVLLDYIWTERNDLAGQSDHSTHEIKIGKHAPSGELKSLSSVEQTFMHEIVHCVDVVYNGQDLEENTVERLAQGLYQVFKDNGMLA